MKLSLILLFILIPVVAFSQFAFLFSVEKDSILTIKRNQELVDLLISSISNLERFNGKQVINIPVKVRLDSGATYIYYNDVVEQVVKYSFNSVTDKVSFDDIKVLGYLINFKKKTYKTLGPGDKEEEDSKSKDLDQIVKKLEHAKEKAWGKK